MWSHTKQKKRGIGLSSWRLPYEWVNRRLPLTVLHDSFAVHQGPFGPTCQTSFSLQVQDYSTARRCCQLKRGWQRRKKRCFWSKSGEFDANINTFSKQNGESMKTSSFLQRKNPINPLPRNDFLKFPTNRLSPLFLFFLPHFVVTKERVEIQKCEFLLNLRLWAKWNSKIPKLPQFFRLSNRSILWENTNKYHGRLLFASICIKQAVDDKLPANCLSDFSCFSHQNRMCANNTPHLWCEQLEFS